MALSGMVSLFAPGSLAPAALTMRPPRSLPLTRRLVAFDHCRIPLRSFDFLPRTDPLSRLHQRLLELETDAPRPASRFHRSVAAALWLAIGLLAALRFHRRYSAHVRRTHGISARHQFADLCYGVWRHNTFPRHYYWRKLFLLPNRSAWLANLEHRQVNDLVTDLNRALPVHRIADKFAFYQHCLATGLPTPPVLAAWRHGERCDSPADTGDRLPAQDLFAKPIADYGSVGTLAFRYDAQRHAYHSEAGVLDSAALLEYLRQRSLGTGYILQPRLVNGGVWADYGDRDLCNLRIVTGRFPDGEPQLISSFLRLPSSHTTFGHDRHVLLSAVDVATGTLGPGVFREITKGSFDVHPDTGACITGRVLPGWAAMAELTLRAHRTLPWMPFIGWDVVETSAGLHLLEANAFWGADAAQLPGAVPLGHTAFPEIYWAWTAQNSRS
ncbi:hypothetical protein K0B96_06970 [Horticoccus luteus]|uniref:Alpha-L-glutamate ligase-related protein ATP-grasp domain-containing protein n=1 Tax=Horticoccus luteus TaxID=2862869 RepID=A0A8F9TYI4_9BACT|nr:sugar-transfer associated ATP-grasp domain-containing protein [Horticoccus luteus]QYM80346.1 hypothetical protein K0B96_06970 [Horticoccus luteus]